MPIGNFEQESQGIGGGGFGFGGGGMGAFGLVGLIGLLGRRGLGGGGDDCESAPTSPFILSKLGDIQNEISSSGAATNAAVGAATASIKDSTQNQTLFLQGILNNNQLSALAGLTNVKDTVQLGVTALAASMAEGFCSVKGVVHSESEATRALINAINSESLNRQLTDAKNQITELRFEDRSRSHAKETEVNITQTVNQNQAQAQQQQQFQAVANAIAALHGELQIQRFSNKTVQVGAGNVATPVNNGQQIG